MVEARPQATNAATIARAVQHGDESLINNKGIIDHPGDRLPPPAKETVFELFHNGERL